MLDRGVIERPVYENADAALACLLHKHFEIFERSKLLAHAAVIDHIITVVDQGRWVVGKEVQCVDAERFKVFEFCYQSTYGACEFIDVELVYLCLFPPVFFLSLIHISEPTRQAEISYAV